jgi:hypothetical protein
MAAAIGIPAGAALLGGMGGKQQARAASQPTRFSQTSTMQPYGGGNPYLDWYLGQAGQAAQNWPDTSPNFALDAYKNFGKGRVGAPGFGDIWSQVKGAMGGLGGGNAEGRLKDFQVNLRPEHQALISGEYLDENNPRLQAVLGNLGREANEDFARSIPSLTAQFGAGGRYGGGLMGDSLVKATEEFNEGLMGTKGQMILSNYEAERDRMVQGMQMAAQLDASGRSDLAGVIRQQISAKAQMLASAMSSYMGLLGQGMMARNQRDIAGLGASFQLDEAMNRAKMGDVDSLSWLAQMALPILGQYGTQSTSGVQQGPKYSSRGGFLQGAAGGGLGGAGLVGNLGGFGGKGGGGGAGGYGGGMGYVPGGYGGPGFGGF